MPFRDRIRDLRRVKAALLQQNPRNWRTHPKQQRDALRGLLAEIGYAGALVARELEDGSLQLIDGHLRAETTPDQAVPVLVVDLTQEEADKLLALHDPLAAMAGRDDETLGDLLASIETQDAAVRELIDRLSQPPELPDLNAADKEPNARQREAVVRDAWQLLVDCRDESDQKSLFERLTHEGYPCRVLTL